MDRATGESLDRTRQVRIMLMALGGIMVLLLAAYFYFVRMSYASLYEDLRPTQAVLIAGELEERDIAFRVRDGGRTILVPASTVDAVRLSIEGATAPTNRLTGFELFNDSDMGLTDFAQRIKFQRALQGELTRTIMSIHGVEEARVHLSIPERTLFRGEAAVPKAAIYLTSELGAAPSRSRIVGIQRLVSAAVADLKAADVVVLNDVGEIISAHDDTVYAGSVESLSNLRQRANYFKARAEQAIDSAIAGLEYEVLASMPPRQSKVEETESGNGDTAGEYAAKLIIVTDRALQQGEQDMIRLAIEDVGLLPSVAEALVFRQRLQPFEARDTVTSINAEGRAPDDARHGRYWGSLPIVSRFSGGKSLWVVLSAAIGGCALILSILAWVILRRRRSRSEHKDFAENLRLQLAMLEET